MEPGNLKNLMVKVKTIAHGPHAPLLEKFIDLLYREMWQDTRRLDPTGNHK